MPTDNKKKNDTELQHVTIGTEDPEIPIYTTAAPFNITVRTKQGYIAKLQPDGSNWQAIVYDETFPGFHRTFIAPVRFSPGYTVKDLIQNNTNWQHRHIQLLSTNIIYVGSIGLKGGGAKQSHRHNCSNYATYSCSYCGLVCPRKACNNCCIHKNHPCAARVRVEQQQRLALLALKEKEKQRLEQQRQDVLSKLHASLSSAQTNYPAEELADISEDESTNYFDTSQTREEDTYVFMHHGGPAREWNDEAGYVTDEKEIEDETAVSPSTFETHVTQSNQKDETINCFNVIHTTPTRSDSNSTISPAKISRHEPVAHITNEMIADNDTSEVSSSPNSFVLPLSSDHKVTENIEASNSTTTDTIPPFTTEAECPTITEIIISHLTDYLSPEEQTSFRERFGKIIESKLTEAELPLQQTILGHVINGSNLYDYILEAYPVSEWIPQSLIKEVVAFSHESVDHFLLYRFRKSWSEITKKYNTNQKEILLRVLKQQKVLHAFNLLQINDLLDLVLATGFDGYGILCGQKENWLDALKTLWLTPQVNTLCFSDEDQNVLRTALVDLPWSITVTQQFLKAIKKENMIAPILNFLFVVREKEVVDSVVMATIWMVDTVDTNSNKCNQWVHALNYHLLYNTIYQLSPQIAHSINWSVFNKLSTTCSADLLESFITGHVDLLEQHSSGFAKVLDQLYNYQATQSICAAALQELPDIPVTDWPSKIDALIVDHLFEASHEYSVAELVDHIADKSPNVSFTQKENLMRHYESILQAYQTPAGAFNLQKVCSTSYDALNNFDHFASNHPDLSLSGSSLKKLKTKPISQWDKQEVQLWSEYIKPNSETKLSTRVPESELIAVVQRAVELQHGFLPRATQLLSILMLLNPADTGRLVQINTGEGKSLIVAMLGAIYALEGKQVDVITTSTELSIPEVKKQQPFFELLALKVGENSQNSNKTLVYKSDVLYGTAGDFQGDILRTEFLGMDCRGVRKFQTVIVDEVDSMLFDNRFHSVRLAEESPGMNHLELALGVIWEYLHRLAKHLINQDGQVFFIPEDFEIIGKKINLLSGDPWESCATPVTDKRSFLSERAEEHLEKLLRDLTEQEKAEYENYQEVNIRIQCLSEDIFHITNAEQKEAKNLECKKLSASLKEMDWSKRDNPIIDIPVHLRAFAKFQIPYWIKNALDAAFAYKKDAHYTVVNDKIIPVNFSETGVLQSYMVWSDGLTQFLQLKEGLSIDPEGVSTNFISNVSFFKRYGKDIYGTTGTLGDQSTHDFLHEMYGTDMVIIPPYKQQKITNNDHTPYLCKELAPIIVSEERNWYKTVIDQALYHSANQRGVLVICKYISQVDYLYKVLNQQHDPDKVFSYTGQGNAFTKNDIAASEIIIATNIAGRGTDFKTSEEVEAHGGMYVAVTFLPESYRVEMQNVGRTGREGKKGMAQLIVHNQANSDIQVMKQLRNEQEATATKNAIKDAKKVLHQDTLFHRFCQVEDQLLPTVNESEQLQRWKRLSTDWNNYAAIKLDPQKIADKSRQWVNKTKQQLIDAIGSISTAEKSKLTSNDLQNLHEQAGRQAESERCSFAQRYKKNVLERFCSQSEHMSQAFFECLQQGKVFEPNYSELAKKYNWGKYERRGTEETWGFWLKEKHLEDKEIPMSAMLADFEASFVSPFKDKADKDRLVHNPYFYVLKGNEHLMLGELFNAGVCYDRAISMDPIFSVNARYNKAHALLLYAKNAGQRQQLALQELKKAKKIILGTYKTELMTFNTLIAQNGCKIKTSQHVQHQLNILTEQENHIVKACDIIEKAQKENHDVKLTSTTLKETIQKSEDNHGKAIREAMVNGLIYLFAVEEVIPIPWWSIISVALIGLAQIALGCILVAFTGSLGMGLISEGVSDLIASVQSAISGSFSWAAWATQKVISLAVSLISAGWNALKSGLQAIKTTVKGIVSKTAVMSLKDGWKLAGKEVVLALSVGITKECLMEAGQWCTNKLFMEDLEKEIQKKAGMAITTALSNNPLILEALKEDEKNGNSYWQQLFIKEGLALLQEKTEHVCFVMLREIGLGVAKNKNPLFDVCSKVAGVTKMLDELTNYTNNFIIQFNTRVASHKNDIKAAKSSAYTKEVSSPTNHVHEIVTSAAPPVDLEEEDIAVHTLVEETEYRSKVDTEPTQLQSTYNNLGPSTTESLANHFKSHISSKLTGSIKMHLINPVLGAGIDKLTGRMYKEMNQTVEALRNKVKPMQKNRCVGNELANTTERLENEKGIKTPPKEEVQLTERAQEAVRRINNNEVQDGAELGVIANVAEATIYVYNENNKLKYVAGDDLPGKPILLKHTAATDENHQSHFSSMNDNVNVEKKSSLNYAMDAILPQLSVAKLEKLKDINGFKEVIIETIRNNPEGTNTSYESHDTLAAIAPNKMFVGQMYHGAPKEIKKKRKRVVKIDSDSSTMDMAGPNQIQNHHIIHQQFKDHPVIIKSGINIIKDIKNLVSLPTKKDKAILGTDRSVHTGRHTNVVVEKLKTNLDDIYQKGQNENWNTNDYKNAIYSFIKDQRREMRKGTIDLYE